MMNKNHESVVVLFPLIATAFGIRDLFESRVAIFNFLLRHHHLGTTPSSDTNAAVSEVEERHDSFFRCGYSRGGLFLPMRF